VKKRFLILILSVISSSLFSDQSIAEASQLTHHSSTHSNSSLKVKSSRIKNVSSNKGLSIKNCHVRSYTRKNGTKVSAYDRRC
jgi:hypothetical protein